MARDLPILATVFYAYKLTFSDFLYAIRISWHWFVLFLIAVVLPNVLLGGWNGESSSPSISWQLGEPLSTTIVALFAYVLIVILTFVIATASVAVLWHRHLLLGEHRDGIPVQINGRMLGYCLRFLLIGLILMIVAFPLLMLHPRDLETLEDTVTSFWIWSTVAGLILGMLFMRLGVALPAMAVDNKGFGLIKAWKQTAGNGFFLIIAMALISIPFWALDVMLSEAVQRGFLPQDNLVMDVLSLAYYLFASLVWVSLLTLSYAYLVEGRQLGSPPPSSASAAGFDSSHGSMTNP